MRKRLLSPILPSSNQRVLLSESEANHAQRVLRLRSGEEVEVLDGRGNHILARLRMSELGVQLEYLGPLSKEGGSERGLSVVPLDLEMAVLKGEAMEWVVEKAVELGVRKLIPLLTDHTVIQTKAKGPAFFQERWQRIADQALKQCGRLERLQVEAPIGLDEVLRRRPSLTRIWCDEEKANGGGLSLANWILKNPPSPTKEVSILIGPEGGWSQNERNQLSIFSEQSEGGAISLSLGPLVLRAETAAIVSMGLISSFMRAGF
jgi:16S rRNA (uracil1498-N3)-methyltransferase